MLVPGEDMNAAQARDVGLGARVIDEAAFAPEVARELEARWAEVASASEDFREGVTAFGKSARWRVAVGNLTRLN